MSHQQPVVVRTTGSTVLFAIIGALAVLGLGSIIVGDFTLRGLAVAGIPVVLLVGVWAVYRFPRVELRHREIALINPLKTVTIPWNLVDGFDTHFGLGARTTSSSAKTPSSGSTITSSDTPGTKVYSSWPLAGKGKKFEKDEHGVRRLIDSPSPAVDTVLEHFAGLGDDELANPRGERGITEQWNSRVIGLLVLAAVWAIIGIMALPS